MTIQELEMFINEYGKGIYSFCKKLCKNSDLTEELYQDLWLKACRNIDELETNQNVKSYFLSLAIGIWRNKKRKFAWRNRIAPQKELIHETDIDQENAVGEGDILSDIIEDERKAAVLEAVNSLKDHYRLPVLLYYMEEQSIKDIANLLNVPEGTIKRRLWTAREKLKKKLEAYIDE
jgi:RNA polymerase sigma-70 factor (ECF subfamily)